MVDVSLRRDTKARMEANLRRREFRERMGQIYIVEAVGLNRVKIGFALQPFKRLRSVAVICPVPLRLRALIDGPPALERELHYRFREAWAHGEWFNIIAPISTYMERHECEPMDFYGMKMPRAAYSD